MDWNLIGGSIGLVFSEFVKMDGILFSVNLNDFAFMALVSASNDDNFIIFSDWDRSDIMFFAKVF